MQQGSRSDSGSAWYPFAPRRLKVRKADRRKGVGLSPSATRFDECRLAKSPKPTQLLPGPAKFWRGPKSPPLPLFSCSAAEGAFGTGTIGAKGSTMGNVCGSKREDTVIVYDERDRPRRVSVSEYSHINAAQQRKLSSKNVANCKGAPKCPSSGAGADGAEYAGSSPSTSKPCTLHPAPCTLQPMRYPHRSLVHPPSRFAIKYAPSFLPARPSSSGT